MDLIVIRFTTRLFDVANERPNDIRLLGKAKMAADDECAAYVREVLEHEPAFVDVSID